MSATRIVGYYALMVLVTIGFLVVGILFFPVYVVGEAWRRRGERK